MRRNTWSYDNITGTTADADLIIRAHTVLVGGLIGLADLEAMVDIAPTDWNLALHSIEILGYGAVIDGGLLLTVTPRYADPDA